MNVEEQNSVDSILEEKKPWNIFEYLESSSTLNQDL